MAKKRGLASNRGLDALLGSIKKEKQITQSALMENSLSNQNDGSAVDGLAQTHQSHDNQHHDATHEPKPSVLATQTVKKNTKTSRQSQSNLASETSSEDQVSLIQISVTQLQSGKYQPRRDMSEEALTELAASIRQHGVMQPIVIRPLLAKEDKTHPEVTHEIIAGERRWRAAKMAGKTHIPAIERALSDELAIALALIENIQREDLSVIEQAAALQRFHTEFGMSHAMIAEVVGKARTTVSNLLRLNQLHDDVKDYLADNLIDMGHARTLLSLSAEQQPIIAKKIIDSDMTVREAERLVKSILNPVEETVKTVDDNQHEIEKLSQRLSDALGATVKLKQKKDGKGSLEIFFYSNEELSALIEQLKA